ncbi:hypothetical protein FS749_007857 [Ceratobasidium sp. UAMH 11750]|nr:hypothetical protein FS749_007857 [Ceratobasidium sp. UAMH 11750]
MRWVQPTPWPPTSIKKQSHRPSSNRPPLLLTAIQTTMNSPVVIVSQYRSKDRQLSMPTTQDSSGCGEPRLLSLAWQPCSQRHAPIAASLSDINETMDRYWTLVFEFTHPVTLDFRDLQAGELASTRNSLMVFEYGQGLWNLLDSLRNMRVGQDEAAALERSIKKVEASLEDLRAWVDEQQMQQLSDENVRSTN